MRAFITGLSGPTLTAAERQFVRDEDPWGLILFKRNVTTPDALRRLIAEFARLRPPHPLFFHPRRVYTLAKLEAAIFYPGLIV